MQRIAQYYRTACDHGPGQSRPDGPGIFADVFIADKRSYCLDPTNEYFANEFDYEKHTARKSPGDFADQRGLLVFFQIGVVDFDQKPIEHQVFGECVDPPREPGNQRRKSPQDVALVSRDQQYQQEKTDKDQCELHQLRVFFVKLHGLLSGCGSASSLPNRMWIMFEQ